MRPDSDASSFANQHHGTRQQIDICCVTTSWLKSCTPGYPPFIVIDRWDSRHIMIYVERFKAIAVYTDHGLAWHRDRLLTNPADLLAALPASARQVVAPSGTTGQGQPATLRAVFGLTEHRTDSVEDEPGTLEALNRLVGERALGKVRNDLAAWTAQLQSAE